MQHDKNEDIYRLSTYYYDLPPELIAQYPAEYRDSSRLLVLDRKSGDLNDRAFKDISLYLKKGDALVLNETRVIPARFFAYKESGARVEILLLKKLGDDWEALVKPARRLKAGSRVFLSPDQPLVIEIVEELDFAGGRRVRFQDSVDEDTLLQEQGHIPLPPYINRPDEELDRERYQTVYACKSGSVAAPTAGLHFTPDLLKEITLQGINIVRIVLHVGMGTFRPVKNEDIRQHNMHLEYYEVAEDAAALLNLTRESGGQIVAVGTTVVRTLESVYNKDCGFLAGKGETNKYIFPGYQFRAIDKLLTNFHLPGSSLLMLVAGFAGTESTLAAYRHAVENRYRFFSYGDAMLVI